MSISGYTIYRGDRDKRIQGGTAIYVREDIVVSDHRAFSNSWCELTMIHILSLNLAVIAVYRPPECNEEKFKEALLMIQSFLDSLEEPDTIIMGDFNMPSINWATDEIKAAGRSSDEINSAKHLLTFMEEHFLQQYVDKPTRNDNILDLILTNNLLSMIYLQKKPECLIMILSTA